MKITLKDDTKPYCLTTARRLPFPLSPKVEEELCRMEREGIIQKVTEPTDWYVPMVPVVKKNVKIRVCQFEKTEQGRETRALYAPKP